MNRTNTIRMLIPLWLTGMIAIHAMGQAGDTALGKEQIIGKAWKAMFGEHSDADIRSIYVEAYFHGRSEPSRMTVRRPDLFRNENPSGVLVFDGKRAAWATRTPDEKGNPRGPELIEAKYWRHFEVDIAILFPAFFDHPAELKGIEKVNGADAYRLYVPLPLGGNVTYFIDSKNFLVVRRLVGWDGDLDPALWENWIDGYTNYDGVLLPDGYIFEGRNGREKGFYKNARFNIDPGDELFAIPEELDH